jgi:hypothetical protein
MSTAADDPVRAEVERRVRAFVEAALAVPGAAAARVGRCVGGRVGHVTERVAEPMQLLRSLLELVTGAPAANGGPAAPVASQTTAPEESPSGPAAPAAAQLPIEEYESLAASHVVARLANLDPAELREVRRFEIAHRGRRTVLGRIDQLLGATTPT